MTVSHFLMAISNASWTPLKSKFTSIASNLQAIAVVPGLSFVSHEPKECHVNRSCTELEGFKMEAKILTKAMENLT